MIASNLLRPSQVAREDGWKVFAGRKVGVVTNPTGVFPRTMEHVVDAMHASSAVDLRAVFGPEHGFRGAAQAGSSGVKAPAAASAGGSSVASFDDPRTGIPVYDTYKKSGAELAALLTASGVDTVAFDIQDVGARFYTYVWTLYDVMVAAAAAQPPISVVVFDRPNPLGGEVVEGPVRIDDGFASFVGRRPIAVRHGMTVGELAWMFNKRFVPSDPDNPGGHPVKLAVVPMREWRRHMRWEHTGLPWVPPSPNMPTPGTALAYVGTCLLEGTNCSEGRGTTMPFELVGATWADGALAAEMKATRRSGRARHDGEDGDADGERKGERGGRGSGARETDGNGAGSGNGNENGGFVFGGTRESIGLRSPLNSPPMSPIKRRPRGREGGGRRTLADAASDSTSGGSRSGGMATPRPGPAATYREAYFTPTSGAHKNALVAGVQMFPAGPDRALFREGVELLLAMKRLYPGGFGWKEQAAAADRYKAARRRAAAAAVFATPPGTPSRVPSTPEKPTPLGISSIAGGAARTHAHAHASASAAGNDPGSSRSPRGSEAGSSRSSLERQGGAPRPPPPAAATAAGGRPPFIDLLTGSSRLRLAIDASCVNEDRGAEGREALDRVLALWELERRNFAELRQGFLLYS